MTGEVIQASTRIMGIVDRRIKREFLTDKGASESIFPATKEDRKNRELHHYRQYTAHFLGHRQPL